MAAKSYYCLCFRQSSSRKADSKEQQGKACSPENTDQRSVSAPACVRLTPLATRKAEEGGFQKDFIYLFLERGEWREKKREGNIDVRENRD